MQRPVVLALPDPPVRFSLSTLGRHQLELVRPLLALAPSLRSLRVFNLSLAAGWHWPRNGRYARRLHRYGVHCE